MAKSCVKIIVVVFNVLFLLIGLALVGLGIWGYFDSSLEQYRSKPFNISCFIIMGLGGITSLIAFCGCCGAIYMSPCLLGIYFTLLLILFIIQVGVAVLGFLISSAITFFVDAINMGYAKMVDDAIVNSTSMKQLDAFQYQLKCCGDRRGVAAFRITEIPPSCCKSKLLADTLPSACAITEVSYPSCTDMLQKKVETYRTIGLSVILVVAAIELLAMIFSMILCCNARRYEEEGYIGVGVVA